MRTTLDPQLIKLFTMNMTMTKDQQQFLDVFRDTVHDLFSLTSGPLDHDVFDTLEEMFNYWHMYYGNTDDLAQIWEQEKNQALEMVEKSC